MINEEMINNRIGRNVKRYRTLYNANVGELTQSDLAKRVGVSVSLIGGLESKNCKSGISLYNLYKISEVLGISIDKFFE